MARALGRPSTIVVLFHLHISCESWPVGMFVHRPQSQRKIPHNGKESLDRLCERIDGGRHAHKCKWVFSFGSYFMQATCYSEAVIQLFAVRPKEVCLKAYH